MARKRRELVVPVHSYPHGDSYRSELPAREVTVWSGKDAALASIRANAAAQEDSADKIMRDLERELLEIPQPSPWWDATKGPPPEVEVERLRVEALCHVRRYRQGLGDRAQAVALAMRHSQRIQALRSERDALLGRKLHQGFSDAAKKRHAGSADLDRELRLHLATYIGPKWPLKVPVAHVRELVRKKHGIALSADTIKKRLQRLGLLEKKFTKEK